MRHEDINLRTLLHRYWITFKNPPPLSAFEIGCGVTAFDYPDALEILRRVVFVDQPFQVESVQENVDIQTLDQNHVVPNMGVVIFRGIWYPLGYPLVRA